MKLEGDKLTQARSDFETELQGMKSRMSILQAVHSTGSRNHRGFQTATPASPDLKRLVKFSTFWVSLIACSYSTKSNFYRFLILS